MIHELLKIAKNPQLFFIIYYFEQNAYIYSLLEHLGSK